MIRCFNRGFNRTAVAYSAVICGLAAFGGDGVRDCFTPDEMMNLCSACSASAVELVQATVLWRPWSTADCSVYSD